MLYEYNFLKLTKCDPKLDHIEKDSSKFVKQKNIGENEIQGMKHTAIGFLESTQDIGIISHFLCKYIEGLT